MMEESHLRADPESMLRLRALARQRSLNERRQAKDLELRMESASLPPGWEPKTWAQKAALSSQADILFFGGAAGSLKTETMLVDASLEVTNPNLRGIIFRQQFTQMSDIIDKTHKLYKPLNGTFNGSSYTWNFPSGANIRLAYIGADKDIWQYLGPRYSFIGFDESTLHTEYQVRNMLGRMSSTDRRLRLRMRLASNPGNIGAGWHKKMFLREACPVHEPEKCPKPGELYLDACWPSDSYPLQDADGNGFSVTFIPGHLSDHDLLDEKYVYRLRMMSGQLSKAMEQGCWCELQGAYFSIWDKARMVIPFGGVQATWWDAHFLSIDYGFGKSSSCAHMHVRTQAGPIITVGEFVAPNLAAHEFAQQVLERFVVPDTGGQRRRIVATFLDPANFNPDYDLRRGTGGHSVANQMDLVFVGHELGCRKASNDRIGGWQLMYQMLQKGEWLIADTCKQLIESLPSRMHDEKKPGDLLKVPGDPLDDVADCARYGIYSFITAEEMPLELRIRERIAPLVKAADLTSASIRYQQAMDEYGAQDQPARFGRYTPGRR